MESIPLDILENGILPRLPAKSLMRFKCVSKPWLALISSHEFIHRHLSYALTSTTNDLFILTGNNSCLYSFDLGLPEAPAVKVPSFGSYPSVVGSCNGLLFIESHMLYSLHLLNPSTGSYLKIPSFIPPRYGALNYGLGYDSRNDDYKLVRLEDSMPCFPFHDPLITRRVEVFSLSTYSWEVIERTSPPQDCMGDHENGALIRNSLLHWKFWCPQQGGRYRIRCFDICEKQWTHDVPFPDNHPSEYDRDAVLDFGALDGKLYLSIKNRLQSAVDIWVMNEYGMKESWVKLFQVSDLRVFQSLRVSLIANRRLKGQMLVSTMNKTEHNILWYNIQDETVETVEFNGVANIIRVNVCKGSLVNVPGGSQCETDRI